MKKLFILKEKCGQSLSENVFNTIFRKLNIDYEYRQLYFPPEHLQTIVEKLRKDSDTIGFNVTIPYKTEIFKYIQDKYRDAYTSNVISFQHHRYYVINIETVQNFSRNGRLLSPDQWKPGEKRQQ